MRPKPKVLITDPVLATEPAFEDIYKEYEKTFDLIHSTASNRAEFIEELKGPAKDIDGLERSIYFYYDVLGGKFDKELINALPPTVKIVAASQSGYDGIDVQYFNEKGITYANSPRGPIIPCAESTVWHILNVFRGYKRLINNAVSAEYPDLVPSSWSENPTNAMYERVPLIPQFTVLYRKTCGIVGLGGIGKEVAKRIAAFGMNVHYHNRNQVKETTGLPELTYHSSLESIMKVVDVLVLICPLTPETYHMINDQSLAKAKDGIRIVNVGRGGLLDTDALIRAINSGKVQSAALDVWEGEPKIDIRFVENPRVSFTPHCSGLSIDCIRSFALQKLENLRTVLIEGKEAATALKA